MTVCVAFFDWKMPHDGFLGHEGKFVCDKKFVNIYVFQSNGIALNITS